MAYKLPCIPSSQAYKEETADFWEIQAIRNPAQFISQSQILSVLSLELDEISHDGIESEDDTLNSELEDVFIELERRIQFTSNKYPFSFQRYSLRLVDQQSVFKSVYLFLLLCTRFNMKNLKVQNGIDGTLLFEKLCAVVARNYFGNASESFVFGTANPGNFKEKVSGLISEVGEGLCFKNPNNNPPTKNDDSVDVIAWKEFSDQRKGKLIAFGQCKTGTTWHDDIHKLKPVNFCSNWLAQQPIVPPLPFVFLCDTLNENFNFISNQQGYLFFNRFRILEYINEDLEEEILADVEKWLEGAFLILGINN